MEDLLDNFLIVLNISISEKLVSMEAQSIETISLIMQKENEIL